MATSPLPNPHLDPDAELLTKRSLHPVDLRALEYVDSYDHNLICHSPLVKPVRLECEHVFCRHCVNEAVYHQGRDLGTNSTTCPSCRRNLDHRKIVPVTKVLTHILDELRVKCPFKDDGCCEIKPRGDVQDHVDKYCNYAEIECPMKSCSLTLRRKDAQGQQCLHNEVKCQDCEDPLMEKDLENHRQHYCEVGTTSCPDCNARVLRKSLKVHVESCVEARFPCSAAPYGCQFTASRITLQGHLETCPLAKLVPFLKTQNDRLESHEAALKHLRHKISILETSFATIQENLNPSVDLIDIPSSSVPGSDAVPFDSTAHHLLCLHESLREEVNRVSAALSDMDAKASMMVMNEKLRVQEDFSHTNAAIAGMRMQLHWLMSARLQNQQRVAMVRAQSSGEGIESSAGSTSADSNGGVSLPVRRLSDSTRQDPKL